MFDTYGRLLELRVGELLLQSRRGVRDVLDLRLFVLRDVHVGELLRLR